MPKENELKRAQSFYNLVSPVLDSYFKHKYELTEFCAGNGNASKIFFRNGLVKRINFVDIIRVRGLEETLAEICGYGKIFLEGIEKYNFNHNLNQAVIAVHACGELTDKILEKAVKARMPVAVMPCCYNSKMKKYRLTSPPERRILLYSRILDYYDSSRVRFLEENNYHTFLLKAKEAPTPMNNVIIGLPN